MTRARCPTFHLVFTILLSTMTDAAAQTFRKENGKETFLEVFADKVRRYDDAPLQRQKRSLIFPSGSILQLSLGIGVNPNIQDISMNINFGFQQNVPLPTNLTQLRLPPDFSRQGKAVSSNYLFFSLEKNLERYGLHRSCVKKAICEMSHSTFHYDDILEEIVTHIFSPSAHCLRGSNCSVDESYIESEKLGQQGERCEGAFPLCPKSLLDIISALI